MKIYIAGSWADREAVKDLMVYLEDIGHVITRDWTVHNKKNMNHEYATEDINGINNCDVFILFLSKEKSFGKAFEMGYACSADKHIIAFGNTKFATSVFFSVFGTVSLNNHEVQRIMRIDTVSYLIDYLSAHENVSER